MSKTKNRRSGLPNFRFVKASFWVLADERLCVGAKMLLLALGMYADETGLCWPSLKTLEKICQVKRTTLMRYLKQLEKEGLLEVTKCRGTSSQYKLIDPYEVYADSENVMHGLQDWFYRSLVRRGLDRRIVL